MYLFFVGPCTNILQVEHLTNKNLQNATTIILNVQILKPVFRKVEIIQQLIVGTKNFSHFYLTPVSI